MHRERDFVTSTKIFVIEPRKTRIGVVTILVITATIVIVVVRIHFVVTTEIVTTTDLVC